MRLPTPTLQTARLALRPVADRDADALFAVHSNAHALRYWDSLPWTDPARASEFITRSRDLAEQGTGARVAIERRAVGAFVGWCAVSATSMRTSAAPPSGSAWWRQPGVRATPPRPPEP